MGRRNGTLAVSLLALTLAGCASPTPDPWLRLRSSKDPALIESYVRATPDSPYADEARERIALLVEERDRAEAQAADSLAAYEAYVARHPSTPFADEARASIAKWRLEAAWEEARALDTRDGYAAFLDAHPDAEAVEEARAAIERFDDDDEFARARAVDTLAAWEAFVKGRPDSAHRADAGARIEELFRAGAGSAEDHATIDAVLERMRSWEEDDEKNDRRCFFTVEMRLAAPGVADHLLVKTDDYSYVGIGRDYDLTGSAGVDEPTLRYLAPYRVNVMVVSEESLFGDKEALDKLITSAYFRLTERVGIDFMDTNLITCWPRDVEAFKLGTEDGGPVSTQRGYIANVMTGEQLLASLRRVPDEHVAWAVEWIGAQGAMPDSLADRVTLAVASGRDERLAEFGAAVLPLLDDLLATGSPLFASGAARALARLDPSGAAFDALGADAQTAVRLHLPKVIVAEPELAAAFDPGGLAYEAKLAARTRLLETFAGEDDAAREAGRKLPLLGWDPTLPANAVRRLALNDEWSEIVALGRPAVVPLLAYLRNTTSERRWVVMRTLGKLADAHGPVPAAAEFLAQDTELRAILVGAPNDDTGCRGVFGGEAANYLAASTSAEDMRAFGVRTRDPVWAALAGEWFADSEPRAIHDVVAEGKLAWSVHGRTITAAHAELTNLTDHPVHVVIPAGTRFAPASSNKQNMVTVGDESIVLQPGVTESRRVRVACANIERSVPGSTTKFDLERVEPDSDLGRVLAELARNPASDDVTQAAVWLVTDDPTYSKLGILQLVSRPGSGKRQIGEMDTLDALKILDRAGIDVRTRRVWPQMPALLAKFPTFSDPWWERMQQRDRSEVER